jgi:hypothetical protein
MLAVNIAVSINIGFIVAGVVMIVQTIVDVVKKEPRKVWITRLLLGVGVGLVGAFQLLTIPL